jgi:siderophore synthetase component
VTIDPTWRACSAALLAKAIGEFSFEGLLAPERAEPGPAVAEDDEYLLRFPAATYRFTACRGAFGGWRVRSESITRAAGGILGNDIAAPTVDVGRFVVEAAPVIGVSAATLANYLSELTATLTADVVAARTARPVAEIARLDHARVEGHLTGHPWLVANKGRVGFGADDLARFAPEAREAIRLPWLAAHRGLAEFRGTPELSEHLVRERELDADTRSRFATVLTDRGLDPETYVWLPTHPWQLDRVIRTMWADELATGRLVELGQGPDRYLPTQAVRTMSNVDTPTRYQVKLPLRVLNTAVWRGLPSHCTRAAPQISQWLRGIWDRDAELSRADLLGEVASVTVPHPRLSGVDGMPYPWLETLGCLWREPVRHAEDEQAWPLAAVLHVDRHGRALIDEYLGATDPARWVATLIEVLLRPLLRLLYTYGITMNPHGENVLVVTGSDGLPVRAVFKDLVDDVNLSTETIAARGPEPDSFNEVLPRKPWRVLRQYLVDALLVGVFRPLAPLLADRHDLTEDRFWSMVRAVVVDHRRRHPEAADRMRRGDLLSPTFARYPLNGDRLVGTGYTDLPHRQAIAPNGTVANPLFLEETVTPTTS